MFSFHCRAKSGLFRLVAQNASFDPVSKRGMVRDKRLERYRRNAEKCLELAQTFNDQERKRVMLSMANAWLTLAETHLRNSETVLADETPATANEPPEKV
jgi:hypothetical protein